LSMQIPPILDRRARSAVRVALSYYVTNGLSAALGLLLISGGVHLLLGAFAASATSVGVIVCIPPDQAAPKRGKFWQLLPAALLGLPLFFAVQALHAEPVRLGLLLVPATFIAFLAAAWGKRGLPIAISVMFAMIFSMAVPEHDNSGSVLSTSLYFGLGSALYLIWATLANALLNPRYRVQMLADTLLSAATLMHTQARQFTQTSATQSGEQMPLIGQLMRQQAALADQLQTARDILLESPRTARRQQLAAMLLLVLEMRDHLLACELDLDTLKSDPDQLAVLSTLQQVVEALAVDMERLADSLLSGRQAPPFQDHRPRLAALHGNEDAPPPSEADHPSPAMLARGLANRVRNLNGEASSLFALARAEAAPDLALVRTTWQMFVSPGTWSWLPVLALWRWDAPPLRHAIRAALAIATAYALSLALPWGSHDYWILLTIVVVLRGSLAQTLERRNSRVAGTLMGCILAGALLSVHAPVLVLLVVVTLAQAVAHALAVKRYLVTAVAATVLGLVQAHMINAGASPAFDVIERMADTLIGVAIAWAFSYVLPSWERNQIPALVARTMAAQAHHARVALALGQLQAVDNEPELAWRLARREAYDSLSALVQATQRSLSEPRAVRPPLEPLGRMLAHSYQLLAQLTAVKTMLLQRERLKSEAIRTPLMQTAATIEATLTARQRQGTANASGTESTLSLPALPDPFENELSPWVLRRLELAANIAKQLRADSDHVLQSLGN
jgi:uncharacterized membrane protein YccC